MRSRQVAQNVSMSSMELNCEPHCAQTIGDGLPSGRSIVFIPAVRVRARRLNSFLLFMRLSLKRCKGNGAHRRPHAVTKPCGQSRGVQSLENAVEADAHVF
jgi:ribosomal protein L32